MLAELPARFGTQRTRDPAVAEVFDQVRRIAPRATPVLLRGESGSGKEELVHALHVLSGRRGRLIAQNVGALPTGLVEGLLFGTVEGAFTGARDAEGLFRAADGGTLFLDEIGDVEPAVQVRLLRAIDERAVAPLGSTRTRPVDVRIVAASHRDLRALVQAGRFRADLYYRLACWVIRVPPLRERLADLEEICAVLLRTLGLSGAVLTPAALDVLRRDRWPGNARDLRNVLERAALGRDVVDAEHVRFALAQNLRVEGRPRPLRDQIRAAVELAGGNRAAAARALGVSRGQVVRALAGASCGREAPARLDVERARAAVCLAGSVSAAARALGVPRSRLRRALDQHGPG